MHTDDEKRIVTKLTRLQAWRIIAEDDIEDLESSKECMRILEAGTPITLDTQRGITLSRTPASTAAPYEYWLSALAGSEEFLKLWLAWADNPLFQEVPDISEPLEDDDVEELVRDTLGSVETNLEETRRFLLIATEEEHRRVLAGLESALIVVQAFAQSELGIKP